MDPAPGKPEPLLWDERYRNLVEVSPDAIFVNRADRIALANPACARLFGAKDPSELVGLSPVELFDPAHHALVRRRIATVRAGGSVPIVEQKIVRLDGEIRDVEVTAAAFPDPQEPAIQVILRDVTERNRLLEAMRDAEERFRVLVEATAQAVWEADPEGYTFSDSPSWRTYTGQSTEELLGGRWSDAIHPEDRAAAEHAWREAVAARRPIDAEFRLQRAGGGWTWTNVHAAPILGPDGRIRKWVGMNVDVTARKAAEEALRDAGRRKDAFLATLSHELRNPLAAIRNAIFVLDHAAPGTEQAHRARGALPRQVEHLTRLVDDLLDVTRISRGKIELHRRHLDLREIVRSTTDDLRHLFEQCDVDLRVEHGAGPVWVDGDPTRLAQVLGNLLQNAVKFTPARGHVTVGVRTIDHHAELRVRDDGLGIDPRDLERMFEPFMQADRDRTRGGLGLGLSLVKGLVELHGGTVLARSEGLGRGAELVVTLPASVAAPAPEREAAPAAAPAPAGAGRRVLVIEDNVDSAQTLADVLTLLGHHVVVARDATSGLRLASTERPDVVLCDLGLPDRDGYEVARALSADPGLRPPRIFALSGYAQPEDRQRAADAGFDAHVAKPPDMDELAALVASAPERH